MRLQLGAVPTGSMFQRNVDEILKKFPNVFAITDNILVLGYDREGKDNDDTLLRVLKVFRQVNIKLNKDKCHFRCTHVLFFGKIISRNWCET